MTINTTVTGKKETIPDDSTREILSSPLCPTLNKQTASITRVQSLHPRLRSPLTPDLKAASSRICPSPVRSFLPCSQYLLRTPRRIVRQVSSLIAYSLHSPSSLYCFPYSILSFLESHRGERVGGQRAHWLG